jgi:micrococcal nuclease
MYEYQVEIVKVVDGDTVDVNIDLGFGVWLRKERVRLYGIDTPESRTRDIVEKKYGLFAKEYLKALLGKKSTLVTKKDGKGKFGRILGEFIVYDAETDSYRSVNTMMVEKHIAVKYFGQSKEDIESDHLVNRTRLAEQLGMAPPEIS